MKKIEDLEEKVKKEKEEADNKIVKLN